MRMSHDGLFSVNSKKFPKVVYSRLHQPDVSFNDHGDSSLKKFKYVFIMINNVK